MALQNTIGIFKKSFKNLLSLRKNREPVNVKDRKTKIAFFISRVFGPVPLILILWLLSLFNSGLPMNQAIWVYPLILFLTFLVPLSVTTYLLVTKKVKDIEWRNLEDRKKYLTPIVVPSLLTLIVLTYFLTNETTFHLTLLLTSIIFTMGAVWFFFDFKVSGHIVVATISFSAIVLFFGFGFVWIFLFIPLIMWSRYTLKVHTIPELIAGFLLPVAFMVLATLVFGWPGT